MRNGTSSTHQDKGSAEEQKTHTLSYIHICDKSKFPLECLLEVMCFSHINLLINCYCDTYLHEHSNSSKHEVW